MRSPTLSLAVGIVRLGFGMPNPVWWGWRCLGHVLGLVVGRAGDAASSAFTRQPAHRDLALALAPGQPRWRSH